MTRLAALVLVALAFAGCAPRREDDGRVAVTAGFARLADLARAVGGDRVRVTDLTPPGVEPHDLELSSREIDRVDGADVLLYLGGGFQPALEQAAHLARRRVDLLHDGEEKDPHIWLDPVRYAEASKAVEDALVAADPAGADVYRRRGAALRAELAGLDTELREGLAGCRHRTFVTAHAAFGYLARRYGLTQRAITGVSPESEPDPARLADLADLVRKEGLTTVFTEKLVSPKVSAALAREAGVRVAVLDPLEGRLGGGYPAATRANLAALRAALGCP
ncbi:MAG TPA: metal ABC transporter substrate-binding protein [Acidimicrobiales bacterium]|nr:metal ABC transporter substrate-binding protein [Acidimicrobiales bacterium]